MRLIPILRDGRTETSEPVASAICSTVAHYSRAGYESPWIGYLTQDGEQFVGTCAFMSAPKNGRVEIAYFTFPGHEGRGVATDMARQLIAIAEAKDASVQVTARTLPVENASVRILRKLGFAFAGMVENPDDGPVWEWHYEKQLLG